MLGVLLAALPVGVAAQRDACDPAELEVRSLTFRGNRAFSSGQLAGAIALTASTYARRIPGLGGVLGVRRCGNPSLVAIDRARLVIYYRRRGYPEVRVDTNVTRSGRVMDLRFIISEGPLTRIRALDVEGLAAVDPTGRLQRNLPVRRDGPFDQYLLEQARDTLRRRLADAGHPLAQVFVNTDVEQGAGADSAVRTARVALVVQPGPYLTVGRVLVASTPREGRRQKIADAVVERVAGLQPGEPFRQVTLERATRSLYQTDAFQQVRIEPRLDSVPAGDTAQVDVQISVAERFMHTRSVSAGYGTLDCFRTQFEYVDRNLLGRARRLEVTARMSKLGIGAPVDFDGAGTLCPVADPQNTRFGDPYSDRLNYYIGTTLRPPAGPGGRRIPELTLYSERRSEFRAYRRTTPFGAIASVTLPARSGKLPITLAYDLSFGRTEAQPALFCSVLNRCEPDDRRVFEETRRLAVLGANLIRDRTDNAVNPTRGTFARLALRHSSQATFSDTAFRFTSAVLDAAGFWSPLSAVTFAARLQVGRVFGGSESLVPPQERLYAGGPTTVRGFRQNELGPIAYVVNPDTSEFRRTPLAADTFALSVDPRTPPFRVTPVGGTAVVVGNLEARVRSPFLPTLLQWTLFADVGQVWSPGAAEPSLSEVRLRATPGIGARFFSPIGVVRLDFGYNRYAPRAGAAYFNDEPLRSSGVAALQCVSPGNRIPATVRPAGDPDAGRVVQGEYRNCPGTYAPERLRGALGNFTFFFAIGQAF